MQESITSQLIKIQIKIGGLSNVYHQIWNVLHYMVRPWTIAEFGVGERNQGGENGLPKETNIDEKYVQ